MRFAMERINKKDVRLSWYPLKLVLEVSAMETDFNFL